MLLPTDIKCAYAAFPLTYLQLIMVLSKGQGQRYSHFNCEYLANGDRSGKYCYRMKVACSLSIGISTFDHGPFIMSGSRSRTFRWIITQTVTDKARIAIANKYKFAYALCHFHIYIFTSAHSKGQGQDEGAHIFNCEYLAIGDRWGKHCF